MNQKKARQQRRSVRRAVRLEIGEGFEALSMIIRPRPRYVPKWVWISLYVPLFKKKYLGMIYKHMK